MAAAYVAVGRELEEGKATLLWALQNFSPENGIVVVHVYHPAQMIPSIGVVIPAHQLNDTQADEYRRLERENINRVLDEYLTLCSKAKRHAVKLLVEMDDVGEGLLEMIKQYSVNNFVIGAAADKHYLSNMNAPISKTAIKVQQHADPACKIWFVCKGNLICTRDEGLNGYESEHASRLSFTSNKSTSSRDEGLNEHESEESHASRLSFTSSTSTSSRSPSSPQNQEDAGIDDEVSEKLYHALKEVEDLRSKLNEESCMRQKAERDVAWRTQIAKSLLNMYRKEKQQRKEAEIVFAIKNQEMEELKVQQKKMSEELQIMSAEMQRQNTDFNCAIKDSEEKLSAAYHLLSSLQSDYEKLLLDRDNMVKQFEELIRKKEEATTGTARAMSFSEFSYLDIKKATNNFDESMKIGEGGFGNVYKGFLRHTTVAIKMLNPESMQGRSEFHQEVDVLSKLRHPHLVTLIGTCPEACALIYEYCTNGSLDDRLDCKNNTAPLKWQVRMRIAAEICSSLIFLHSSKPMTVVHGDLKPANILINANFVSKLGDFGLCRLLVRSDATTPFRQTYPKGTFGYLDPEFLVTGELTPYCDIYAFGIVLLRLLTGRHPPLVKEVQEALRRNCLHQIIDPTAGMWPFVQAKKLAQLALKCCEPTRKERPNLEREVWKTFEPIMKAASSGRSSYLTSGSLEDNTCIISCFLCPISQEIMKDPHVAADGHTYEAANLKEWFDHGHDTSPMTNNKLRHLELIPNLTLRSAIGEWQQPQLMLV